MSQIFEVVARTPHIVTCGHPFSGLNSRPYAKGVPHDPPHRTASAWGAHQGCWTRRTRLTSADDRPNVVQIEWHLKTTNCSLTTIPTLDVEFITQRPHPKHNHQSLGKPQTRTPSWEDWQCLKTKQAYNTDVTPATSTELHDFRGFLSAQLTCRISHVFWTTKQVKFQPYNNSRGGSHYQITDTIKSSTNLLLQEAPDENRFRHFILDDPNTF